MGRNERGNTLLVVMITTLVFVTIGLAIVSASIGGAKRTTVRETDVNVTYDAIKVVDQITADLSIELGKNELSLKRISPSSLTASLSQTLNNQIFPKFTNKTSISCVNVIDVSNHSPTYLNQSTGAACLNPTTFANLKTFDIDTNNDLTRVYEIVVTGKTADDQKGLVSRTVRKRVILSPLPSFLKYAAGARGTLSLNGSPNISGNLFADQLQIQEDAEYQLTSKQTRSTRTPYPSIFGDFYTTTSAYSKVIDLLKPELFYHQKVPAIKNDSQFVNVDFSETFRDQMEQLFKKMNYPSEISVGNIQNNLNRYALSTFDSSAPIPLGVVAPLVPSEVDLAKLTASVSNPQKAIDNSYKIIDTSYGSTGRIDIPGNLIVTNNVLNEMDIPDLFVNGDLYILANHNVHFNKITTTGNIYMINGQGNMEVTGDLLSSKSIEVQNAGNLVVNGSMLAGIDVSINSRASSELNGNIFTGGSLQLQVLDSPFSISGNMIANGNIMMKGDSNEGADLENDEIIFDSVVYSKGETSISNLNILGANNNEKQLILLSGEKLTITRMNEFNHFDDNKEPENFNGIVQSTNIQPLKAFFYTDKDAELYGVGSLFYINGGIFANRNLVINAIRGNISDILSPPSVSAQDGHYSRFNVNYNREVLLQKIDSLPRVEHLSLFSDEMIVE